MDHKVPKAFRDHREPKVLKAPRARRVQLEQRDLRDRQEPRARKVLKGQQVQPDHKGSLASPGRDPGAVLLHIQSTTPLYREAPASWR